MMVRNLDTLDSTIYSCSCKLGKSHIRTSYAPHTHHIHHHIYIIFIQHSKSHSPLYIIIMIYSLLNYSRICFEILIFVKLRFYKSVRRVAAQIPSVLLTKTSAVHFINSSPMPNTSLGNLEFRALDTQMTVMSPPGIVRSIQLSDANMDSLSFNWTTSRYMGVVLEYLVRTT